MPNQQGVSAKRHPFAPLENIVSQPLFQVNVQNDKNVDILHHFIFDLKTRLARYPIINAPEIPTAALSNPP